MSLTWWDSIVFAVAAGILYRTWRRPSPASLRENGEEFAAENLAYVDSEFVHRFDHASITMRRVHGILVAVLLVPAWFSLKSEQDAGLSLLLVWVTCLISALALFSLWFAGREFPAPEGRRVLARSRHVGVTDFVPPIAVACCVAYVLAECTVGVVALRSIGQDGPFADRGQHVVIAVAAFVVAAMTALLPLYLWAMCRRPESAVDSAHLYLQDAWRADRLQRVTSASGVVAVSVVMQTPYLDSVDSWQGDVHLVVVLALLGSAFLLERRSKLWFCKRLWPELAPGQVLLPGQPIGVAP